MSVVSELMVVIIGAGGFILVTSPGACGGVSVSHLVTSHIYNPLNFMASSCSHNQMIFPLNIADVLDIKFKTALQITSIFIKEKGNGH